MSRDIFYNVKELSLVERKKIMKFAKDNSITWWVDELDCSKSFIRQKIDMSFEEVIKKFKMNSHFVIINRQNEYGEVAFSTLRDPDHFLWINVSLEVLDDIISKYNLNKK